MSRSVSVEDAPTPAGSGHGWLWRAFAWLAPNVFRATPRTSAHTGDLPGPTGASSETPSASAALEPIATPQKLAAPLMTNDTVIAPFETDITRATRTEISVDTAAATSNSVLPAAPVREVYVTSHTGNRGASALARQLSVVASLNRKSHDRVDAFGLPVRKAKRSTHAAVGISRQRPSRSEAKVPAKVVTRSAPVHQRSAEVVDLAAVRRRRRAATQRRAA